MIPFSARLQLVKQALVGLFDENALQQADGLLGGVIGTTGAPATRGTKEFLDSYGTMPWVRAIAGKIAYAFASTEWQLFVVERDNRAIRMRGLQSQSDSGIRKKMLLKQKQLGALVEIEEHPFLDSLNNANSYHTGLGLRKLMMLYIDLVGDCFLYKERNAVGGTIALWPIPPHWVLSTPSPTEPYYKVSYRGWQRDIPDTELLWISDPNPANPYGRGVGHSQAVGDELETDEYAAKLVKQVFFNRARPDLLISPKEGTLLPEEVDRLEHRWNSTLQGFHRMLKPFFVRKAIEVKEFSHNFQNLQMSDLRKQQRDTIMQVFGIPPEIMGVLTSSNRATIDSADYLFTKYVVVPRLEFFRAHFQERLVPEYDERLILDYVSPIQEDREMQLKAMQAAPWTVYVDEWREMQGLTALEDNKGKVFALPFNLSFSEEHTGVDLSGLQSAPALPPPDEDEEDLEAEETRAARRRRLRRLTPKQLQEARALVDLVKSDPLV